MKTQTKLKIADIIIQMQSKFPLKQLDRDEQRLQHGERYDNFSYKGQAMPDIKINVEIVDKLPEAIGEVVFITTHFQDGSENWRLLKKGITYIYKSPLEDKKQVILVNKNFSQATAYLLPDKAKGKAWATTDIIYDFLQVLLINYFALHNKGIFTHSVGIKDVDGNGFIFTGKSGAGKSTTARLWHKNSKAMVLNDDRIIVRKVKNKFYIYGSPWHGEFSDYLESKIESAPLKSLFFIHHAPLNKARRIPEKEAFSLLYPSLFPTFWDKKCLENIVSFCEDLIKNVPCYNLGFVNDKNVIGFVRNLNI